MTNWEFWKEQVEKGLVSQQVYDKARRQERKMSRAERAGTVLAKSIIELGNLMYQENTKANFYKGLMNVLRKEVS